MITTGITWQSLIWVNIDKKCLFPHFGRHGRWATAWHDDVMKWKHFPSYWPFVWGIHRSPVNSPHKGQWRGALMFSFIYTWINDWVNNREAGDLRRHRDYYDVVVMGAVLTADMWKKSCAQVTSHYLNQCWHIASKLWRNTSKRIFYLEFSNTFLWLISNE